MRGSWLAFVLAIQAEVNDRARAQGRPLLDMLNAEEVARIEALVAARTWPQRWTGDEPRADEPFEEDAADVVIDDAEDAQGWLFDDFAESA